MMLEAASRCEGWETLARGSLGVQAVGVPGATQSRGASAAHTCEKWHSLRDVCFMEISLEATR